MWMPLRSAKMYGLHLGVPAAGLVSEMDAGLEQLAHRDGRHGAWDLLVRLASARLMARGPATVMSRGRAAPRGEQRACVVRGDGRVRCPCCARRLPWACRGRAESSTRAGQAAPDQRPAIGRLSRSRASTVAPSDPHASGRTRPMPTAGGRFLAAPWEVPTGSWSERSHAWPHGGNAADGPGAALVTMCHLVGGLEARGIRSLTTVEGRGGAASRRQRACRRVRERAVDEVDAPRANGDAPAVRPANRRTSTARLRGRDAPPYARSTDSSGAPNPGRPASGPRRRRASAAGSGRARRCPAPSARPGRCAPRSSSRAPPDGARPPPRRRRRRGAAGSGGRRMAPHGSTASDFAPTSRGIAPVTSGHRQPAFAAERRLRRRRTRTT